MTDADIQLLREAPKAYSAAKAQNLRLTERDGHLSGELPARSPDGTEYSVFVRVSTKDPQDFTVGMRVKISGMGKHLILCRYNGLGHEHCNRLEGEDTFFDRHIHVATERYISSRRKDEGYAQRTDRYVDWRGALRCLIEDWAFVDPAEPDDVQYKLFDLD